MICISFQFIVVFRNQIIVVFRNLKKFSSLEFCWKIQFSDSTTRTSSTIAPLLAINSDLHRVSTFIWATSIIIDLAVNLEHLPFLYAPLLAEQSGSFMAPKWNRKETLFPKQRRRSNPYSRRTVFCKYWKIWTTDIGAWIGNMYGLRMEWFGDQPGLRDVILNLF